MSDSLKMDTDVAYQVLNDLKVYNQEKVPAFKENIMNRVNQTGDHWEANSFNQYDSIWRDLSRYEQHQVEALEKLIQELQREINQWEETARKLGG